MRLLGTLMNFLWSIFGGKRNQQDVAQDRHIKTNQPEFNATKKYPTNHIKTSKYNFITFVPLNLFEQFQRVANLYFLSQIIIMSIPQITALNPVSTAVPLIIVLAASMSKDGYDDYGRHKSDTQLNNQEALVLDDQGHFEKRKWQDVQTGDIIKVSSDESIAVNVAATLSYLNDFNYSFRKLLIDQTKADIVALCTSEASGLCFIETAELDGETNLKVRQPIPETMGMLNSETELHRFRGEVICELPNNRLDKFKGNLLWDDEQFALDNNNLVLRGCVLRNTQWVYGLVIYAGHDSKLMMNSGKGLLKRTKLDRMTNYLVMWIALMLAIICTFLSIMTYVWESNTGKNFQNFLPWESFYKDNAALIAVINWPGFIMVLNTLIPISLYISVEFIRLGQSFLINWDKEMYDKESDTPAVARNTTLTEELGQIQYIFSDKTGTLTQNVMMFKECSINGKLYGNPKELEMNLQDFESLEEDSPDFVDFSSNIYADPTFKFTDQNLKDAIDNGKENEVEFFRLLALCHTVMVEEKTNNAKLSGSRESLEVTDYVPAFNGTMPVLEYQAQSPDEGALVTAARNFGVVFKSRTPSSITILVNGVEEVYELLCILDFDNVRKRMSVIVRKDDRIMFYCKGADTAIYELLTDTSDELKETVQQHLDAFACEGLRTLCLASKELSKDEFNNWMVIFNEARTALDDRDERVFEAYCMIEKDLNLLGATAIEDKLQVGVPDTIANLAEANIKIWVLTGDKQETAINIGYSSMLLTEDMADVFIISGEDIESVKAEIMESYQKVQNALELKSKSSGTRVSFTGVSNLASLNEAGVVLGNTLDTINENDGFAMVISGRSLAFALMEELQLDFVNLALACKAVLCCRVTPLQKALVVDLVKRNVKVTTLAIGDGANDVSMIKAAHIGVGISGKEGRQAVLAADYSFAQFRFLERLLLVHGRWSYWRMSKFLNYFFYKNFAFTLVQFWYNLFAGFSAATLYDTWFLAVYNVCFTSLPVLCMGIFDQDLSAEKCLEFPKLYVPGQKNILFNKLTFALKLLHGTVTSCVLFFFAYGIYHEMTDSDGLSQDLLTHFAVAVGAILVIIVNLQMALDTSHWTWLNHFFIWGSIVFYFIYTFTLYSTTLYALTPTNLPAVGAAINTFRSGAFWATLFLCAVICLFPVVGYRWVQQKLYPSLVDQIRKGAWKAKQSKSTFSVFSRKSRRSLRSRPRSHRSGFAFSQQSGFGEMIMSGRWLPKFMKKSQSFDIPEVNQ